MFNLVACNPSKKPIIVLAEEQDLLDNNIICYNSDFTYLNYQRGGGRDGAFRWVISSPEGEMEDLLLTFNDKYADKLVAGKVISFDFYTGTTLRLVFCEGEKYHYLYKKPLDLGENVRFYTEVGNPIYENQIWMGNLVGNWITIQIRLENDYVPGQTTLGLTEWKWTDGFYLYNNNVYIDNVKIQNDFGV